MVDLDLLGFRQSNMPTRSQFSYTFDNLARVIEHFTEVIGFYRYAICVFDYGATMGFRLALGHPERITAIISQNGNEYKEGLSHGWTPIRAYREVSSEENRKAHRGISDRRDDSLAIHTWRPENKGRTHRTDVEGEEVVR
jgi:pimeloyl-ACP methyl ester carboxylesterase